MLRKPLFVLAFLMPYVAFAQLSKGEGKSVTLKNNKFSCFLPQYFDVQEDPPGVMHKASGTFVIAVKVPSEKKIAQEGLQRSFFEDARYEILSLTEENDARPQGTHSHSWLMRYKMKGFEFERYTTLVTNGEEQYLIIGNYSMKFKNQVVDEVKKVMESFTIR